MSFPLTDRIRSQRGPFSVLISSVLFGTLGFLQAIAPDGATPYVIGTVQTLVGGVALMLWLCLRRQLKLSMFKNWSLHYLLLSIAVMAAFQIVFYLGLSRTNVTVGTILTIGTTPIATALIAWLCFRCKPSARWYPATLMAIAGIFLVNSSGNLSFGALDIALPVLSGILYAAFLVFSPKITADDTPEAVTMVVALACTLILCPVFHLFPTEWIWTARGLFVCLALGIGIEAFTFTLLLYGLRLTPPSTAATLTLAEPMTAALLGIIALGERLNFQEGCGILLIAVTIVLLMKEHG